MTRAKDISKIVTDANLSGTLDVTGDLNVDNATLKVDSTNNRVGISTSSMTSKFEVAVSDNTSIQEAITIKGTQGGAYGGYLGWKDNWSGDSYTGYRGAIIADVPSANSGRLRFFTANSSTLSEKMHIDASGNVGIGTSSPASYYSTELVVATSDNGGITLANSDTSHASYIMFADGTTGSQQYTGQFGYDHNTDAMIFHTNVAERMRIDSSGNVGIGTSSPNAKLDIKDDSNSTQAIIRGRSSDSFGILDFRNNAGDTVKGQIKSDASNRLIFRSGPSTDVMYLNSSGNVGIGTSSPATKLAVSGSIAGTGALNISGSGWGIQPYVANSLLIDNNSGQARLFATGANATTDGSFLFYTSQTDGGTNQRMNISVSGTEFTQNVGNSTTASLYHSDATSPYGIYMKFTGGVIDNNIHYFFAAEDSAATTRVVIYSDGDIYNHDGTFAQISDRRIKDNITDANSQWDDIKAMRFVNYQRKDDIRQYGESEAKVQLGLIGQELEAVSPNLVRSVDPSAGDIISSSEFGSLYVEGDDIPEGKQVGDVKEVTDKVKGVAYSILYLKAVKALQEAMIRIETLETAKTDLEARITALETA